MEGLKGLRNITCEKTSQDQERPWGSTHSYQQLKQKGEGKRETVNGVKMGMKVCRTPLLQCPSADSRHSAWCQGQERPWDHRSHLQPIETRAATSHEVRGAAGTPHTPTLRRHRDCSQGSITPSLHWQRKGAKSRRIPPSNSPPTPLVPAAASGAEPAQTPPHGGCTLTGIGEDATVLCNKFRPFSCKQLLCKKKHNLKATFITNSTILSDIFVLPLYICIYI